jgi:hypothetical protein
MAEGYFRFFKPSYPIRGSYDSMNGLDELIILIDFESMYLCQNM